MSDKTQSRGQKAQGDVTALLRARNTLLWVVTREEVRVERAIVEAAAAAQYEARLWDCASGVTDATGDEVSPGTRGADPQQALRSIATATTRQVWIMRDLVSWLKDPVTLRMLRNLARSLQSATRAEARAVVVLSPSAEVPPELAGHATVIDWPLPDRAEIAAILDDVVKALPPDLAATAAPNGTRDAAIDAAVGLTAEEAAACYARSLVTGRKIDPAVVSTEKKRVIAREKVLEWYDPLPGGLDAVGGLEVLKAWLVQRRAALSAKARARGINPPKGVLLVGQPGCLSEGTRIAYKRGKRPGASGRVLTIETLYEKFNGLGAHAAPPWIPGLPTYLQSWDVETGKLAYNEIASVTDSGIRDCIRIATDVAGAVELTADHPVLLADGTFREASQLRVGDTLLVRGSVKPKRLREKRTYRKRTVVEGLKYHPVAWLKVVDDKKHGNHYEYGRITKARLVVEAEMNKLDYSKYVSILRNDPAGAEVLTYLPAEYDVHHADEDPMNDALGNLVVVTHEEHARRHGAFENFHMQYTAAAHVTAISDVGPRRTFDVSMAEPLTNFVTGDGIIVHNCGKSLTAKAVATAWGVPLLKLDLGALRSKWVGESEGNIRKALAVAETVAPCVLWLDEVEKALAGSAPGASGDGGVASDALGTILGWLQERSGSVFVVATANDVTSLPPELLRKGRFDEVFWIDLPSAPERAAILTATMRAEGRDPATVDAGAVADATEGYSGAEVAALVGEAKLAAYVDGDREVTTADVVAEAGRIIPQSRLAAEVTEKRREWARGRARPASITTATAGNAGKRTLDL